MRLHLGLLAACLLLVGCDPAPPPTPSPGPPVIQIVDSGFGPIIVDANGYSLYSNWDPNRDSTCVDECTTTWEPYIVPANYKVGEGLNQSHFSTVARQDGLQLKFHDYPLYHFHLDGQPGEAKGNGALGIWYMIRADGRVVFEDNPSPTP